MSDYFSKQKINFYVIIFNKIWKIEVKNLSYILFQFSCCGINGSNNYGTSWWRLQEVGRRELVVPISCCLLDNAEQKDAYLNPEPSNITVCQTLNPAIHQYARHSPVSNFLHLNLDFSISSFKIMNYFLEFDFYRVVWRWLKNGVRNKLWFFWL